VYSFARTRQLWTSSLYSCLLLYLFLLLVPQGERVYSIY
jgi:hypothetical protein